MTIADAIKLVLELADSEYQNNLDAQDETAHELKRQGDAIEIVRTIVLAHYAEDAT